ncbi:MAG: ATPase [Candidatus Thorarchaeota archaeon]|nr:MAG: ATPase [Candidatus Thorarchaeota archaeon]
MEVKKRTGETEPFMPEKIVVAVVKSGVSYDVAKQIASSVASKPVSVIKSSEIREIVLSELKSRGLTAAVTHWESYDRKRHKKS